MPSIVEVRVRDAVSPEDAAPLEKDDAPAEPNPPKDFAVSFAESVTRTANVYASSRPPSRRGVSQKTIPETSALEKMKRSVRRSGFVSGFGGRAGGFGGSLPPALERDPALRRLHEETRAARSLAKAYKSRLARAERAADLSHKFVTKYRGASLAAEARAAKAEAATKRLLGDEEAPRTLARLAAETRASAVKLEACITELRELRRANETLRRAREADRKTFRDSEKALLRRLDAAEAGRASLREEVASRARDARRAALEVRALEAKLFRPTPPSRRRENEVGAKQTRPNDAARADAPRESGAPASSVSTRAARLEAPPEPAPDPDPDPNPAPNRSPRLSRDEGTQIEEEEREAAEEHASANRSPPGSSSGGGDDADAPRVVLCVVCVEPESVPAPPAVELPPPSPRGGEPADAERASRRVSEDETRAREDDDTGSEEPCVVGSQTGFANRDARVAPNPPRETFFFARTTVASRSRAGTRTA